MKKLRRSKKNNGGFSLVEVIVTMVVIAIISIPIIKSFVTTARVNHDARRLQNATDVAQQVAERFESVDMETLLADYGSNAEYDINAKVRDSYKFKELSVPGAEGEDFKVDVTLEKASEVYDVPNLKNLYGPNKCLCYSQINKYDAYAVKHFGLANRNGIQKSTTISVVQKIASKYYKYSVHVKYTTASGSFEEDVVIEENYLKDDDETFPTLYVLYVPFDTAGAKNPAQGATDTITVKYDVDIPAQVPTMNVYYLTQSSINSETNSNIAYYLKSEHINIQKTPSDASLEFHNLDEFKESSVVGGGAGDKKNPLTEGGREALLYSVNVNVVYKGKIIANVTTLREELVE